MEKKYSPMTPFDEMVGDDTVQLIKAALPYLSGNGQKILSVCAKTMELRNTLSMFGGTVHSMEVCSSSPSDPAAMLQEIRPFCCGRTGETIDQLLQAMAMIQMMDLLKEP